ncbi:CpXC domain-containing protein [Acetivibrio cellulolyticus]|uniref:hypothetical protein n=1 Tax=Acetivibrio cellulolyticus TaxID=35830 RepID=UPI0001E2F061|nr:hypothetical protein [Acetivibrio cellulolyticus]
MNDELNLYPCEESIEDDIAKERIIKSIGDFIDKLILLEKELGRKVAQEFLDSKSLDFANISDNDAIDSVANKIANFLDLPNKIHVNIDDLSFDTGGSIRPTSDYNVTINLNKNSLKMKDAVLGVLAHELTHQYLFNHGIDLRHKSILDNELLTDIAAIYLGLGNLILNAHRNEKTVYKNKQEVTYKMEIGYVKTFYLGFVYKTICSMRNIPENVYNAQLSSQSKIYITQAMNHNEFSPYLKQNFFDANNTTKTLMDIKEVIYSIQVLLSDIDKNLKADEIRSAKEIEPFLVKTHRMLFKYFEYITNFSLDDTPNRCLKFLYSMKAYQTLEEMLVCLGTAYNSAKSYLNYLTDIHINLNTALVSSSESNMCKVVCRKDGTIFPQITGKSLFVVKCPNCGYQFVASTDNTLNHDKVKNFMFLYNEHFVHTESTNKIVEDQGFIEPIFSFLKSHTYLSLALIFLTIGIIVLIISHVYFSLIFFALGLVFIIIDVFNLAEL